MLNLIFTKKFLKLKLNNLIKYILLKKRFVLLCLIFSCLIIFEISRENEIIFAVYEKKGYRPQLKNKNDTFSTSDCYSAFHYDKKVNFQSNNDLKRVECESNNKLVILHENSSLLFNFDYLKKNDLNLNSCQYSTIKWHDNDFDYKISEPIEIFHGDQVDVNEEFFLITCKPTYFASYKSAYARIFKRKFDEKKRATKKNTSPINVFFLGLDSVSRENWLNLLPRSSEFLLNTLNSTVLNGYNIVGDGTPAALIPLLTSKHEHQLPNTLKNTDNFNYVDQVYPFVWRNYSENLGYATLFAEDWPNIGTFQYRMVGMSEPPTTHYMRPFHLALFGEGVASHSNPCINGQSNFNLNIKYAEDFMRVYKETGFFGFTFINEFSHDSNDQLGMIDDDLHKFLDRFYSDKSLSSSTVLVLFADHGARFSNIRKSVRGLLQERNPFFSIYLPSRFQHKYPAEYENLKSNWNKLTTPMDIHKTFINLLNLEMNKKTDADNELNDDKTSVSLFTRIPSKRNCAEAGIEPHWCACLKRSELLIDSNLIRIGKMFVTYLNTKILGKHLDTCQKLKLDSVNKVFLLDSFIDKKKLDAASAQLSSLNLLKAPNVETDYEQLFFQLRTKPNNAVFEFTVILEISLKSFVSRNNFLDSVKINENSISRINKYGNSSECIEKTFPDLRKYCFCKKI